MIEALYIHVPFCHAKCSYCDFYSRPMRGEALMGAARAFARCVVGRVGALAASGALEAVRTAYIGGGTPTVLGPSLAEICRAVSAATPAVEMTCEANPESLDAGLCRLIAGAGATRVSLGVQSLDDAELAAVGRIHRAEDARRAVLDARSAGLACSCDLMCGLPGQTPESWRRSVAGVLSLGVGHLSVYPLAIEEGTPLAARVLKDPGLEPDEDLQAACMEEARSLCRAAGLHPYEVASYARDGAECLHNIAYWTGASYLGIGRSAASMLDRASYDGLAPALSLPAAPPGCARVRFVEDGWEGGAPRYRDLEFLSAPEAAAEDLMLGARMTRGVPGPLVERAGHVLGAGRVARVVGRLEEEGLVRMRGDGGFAPTERGWLMGNELFGPLWGLAAG